MPFSGGSSQVDLVLDRYPIRDRVPDGGRSVLDHPLIDLAGAEQVSDGHYGRYLPRCGATAIILLDAGPRQ